MRGEDLREMREPALIERRKKVPFVAGLLSAILPGLGQVYVGYYRRGFFHVLVVGSTITLLSSNVKGIEPLLGIFVAFFWIYNIIDAVRLANLYNDALMGIGPEDLRHELVLMGRHGSVGGGIVLLVVGFLVLLNRVAGLSFEWLKDWWPIIPIGFGAWLLWQGLRDRRRTTD
ncbi:MAG: LiaI-LiaF-like domain-containing protein [Candidatus Eisenbacteria bacterium]